MLRVTPIAEVDFARHVEHFDVAPSGHAIAVSKDGRAIVLDAGLETIATSWLGKVPASIAIASGGQHIAYATSEKRLKLLDAIGFPIPFDFDGHVDYLSFSYDGALLWCSTGDGDTIALQVFDVASLQRVASVELDDPIGDSAALFRPHPSGVMGVWIAAGQDGQCIRWARVEGTTIAIEELAEVWDCMPPAFDASGDRFATVAGEELRVYSFADDVLLDALPFPSEDDDDQFAEYIAFVGDDRLVFSTVREHIYAVDLDGMNVLGEVIVGDHVPRRVSELYPPLDDDAMSTDLRYFLPIGGTTVVSLHADLPSKERGGGNTRASLWRLP